MKKNKNDLLEIQKSLRSKSPQAVVEWALSYFGNQKVALASSLGAEDQVLTDMVLKTDSEAKIFTLDTGRLHQETYDVISEVRKKYNYTIEILFPERESVEEMVNQNGPNLFFESIENRKLCCSVRKVQPLQRKLRTLDAWICGLRKEQSQNRNTVEVIEWDEGNQLFKVNPLINWNSDAVWTYLKEHQVPYNQLHDKGFPSIGCAPCTRAIQPGEDFRAGRWCWEAEDAKECGLHWKDGKLVRTKK